MKIFESNVTPSETVCFQDMGCVSIRKLNSGGGCAGRGEGGREEEPRAKVPGEGWKGDAVGKDTYCQTRKLEFHLRNPNGRRRKPAPVCCPLTCTRTSLRACALFLHNARMHMP